MSDATALAAAVGPSSDVRLDARTGAPADPTGATADELSWLQTALVQYDVLARVQHGGQGVVYSARQRSTKRPVALKLLLDGPLATDRQRIRFEREAEVISRLRHPNIVALYDSGVVHGRHFCALEYVDGLPIDDYAILNDLAPRAIVRLLVKVGRAVNYAHQNGVIHRDLNPANILVDAGGEPHVLDFGLARDLWQSETEPRFSVTGQVFGTLPFLSPEQAIGQSGKADVRADVYALGVVLYHLLTDDFPYPVDGDAVTVRGAIANAEPIPLRRLIQSGDRDRAVGLEEINGDLELIVAKALAKSPDERYQTAAELADELERFLNSEAITAQPRSRWYRLRKALRRHRLAVGVSTVVAGTVLAASVAVTVAWVQALAQRDNARGAAQAAFGVFDVALNEVEESVRPLAGGMAVRDRLLDGLREQLPRLQHLAQSDAALAPMALRLLEKNGDLAAQKGERAAARECYEKILAQLARSGAAPAAATFGRETLRLRTHRKLALIAEDPAAAFERTTAVAHELLKTAAANAELRYEAAAAFADAGVFYRGQREFARALEFADRALSLRPAGAIGETDLRWTRLAAEALTLKGYVLRESVSGAEALPAFETALGLRERLVAGNPANMELRHELMRSYLELAETKESVGEVALAKELYEDVGRQCDILALIEPDAADWDRTRVQAHAWLAYLAAGYGDSCFAADEGVRAVVIAERALTHDAKNVGAQSDLALALTSYGRALLAQHSLNDACQRFTDALAIRERLSNDAPDDLRLLRDLGTAYHWIATTRRKIDGVHGAMQEYEREYETAQRVLSLQHVAQNAMDCAGAAINLSAAHMSLHSAVGDDTARQLLVAAASQLNALDAAGRLVGREGDARAYLVAIEANFNKLDARAQQRASPRR